MMDERQIVDAVVDTGKNVAALQAQFERFAEEQRRFSDQLGTVATTVTTQNEVIRQIIEQREKSDRINADHELRLSQIEREQDRIAAERKTHLVWLSAIGGLIGAAATAIGGFFTK